VAPDERNDEPIEAAEGRDLDDEQPDEEYPAGSETESEPAGVGDNVEDEDQPGFSEDAPEVD
jgi:hypothetical protein